jgi:hypothetical protein
MEWDRSNKYINLLRPCGGEDFAMGLAMQTETATCIIYTCLNLMLKVGNILQFEEIVENAGALALFPELR